MDAMSFVLGIKTKTLRGDTLKDLIYREGEGDPPAKRGAAVRLYFRAEEAEIVYSREIKAGSGKGEYRINSKVVSEEEYSSRLREHGTRCQYTFAHFAPSVFNAHARPQIFKW